MTLSHQIKNILRAYLIGSEGRMPKGGLFLKMNPKTRYDLSITPEYIVRVSNEGNITYHWERFTIIDDVQMEPMEFMLLTTNQ